MAKNQPSKSLAKSQKKSASVKKQISKVIKSRTPRKVALQHQKDEENGKSRRKVKTLSLKSVSPVAEEESKVEPFVSQ